MIKKQSAVVVYDPLDVSFNIIENGGNLLQTKESNSGRYDPDRTITPLTLTPTLQVKDPNHILNDGDHSSKLFNHRWYYNQEDEQHRITSRTDPDMFVLNTDMSLEICGNVAPGAVNLICLCQYIDARRNEVLNFRKVLALACTSVSDCNLTLEMDAGARLPLSPYKANTLRTIHAQLKNGGTDVADSSATYVWKVATENRAVSTDDPWYVSGIGTKNLTVDTKYIGKVVLQCEANLQTDTTTKVSAMTKLHRWYGQYREDIEIPRGQFILPSTQMCTVRAKVSTNRMGEIDSPQKYFDIILVWKKDLPGENWKVLGYGPTKDIQVTDLTPKYGVNTVFGVQVRELSELRPCKFKGSTFTIDGKIPAIRVPLTESEI